MTKSYVSMEQKICIVCNKAVDTGALLIDRRVKESLEANTITGYQMCPEHQKLKDAGYVALIETEGAATGNKVLLQDAIYTGTVIHLRKHIFEDLFNAEVPDHGICFIEPAVTIALQKLEKVNETNTFKH